MLKAVKLNDFPDTNAITVVDDATTPPAVIATFYDAGDGAEDKADVFVAAWNDDEIKKFCMNYLRDHRSPNDA